MLNCLVVVLFFLQPSSATVNLMLPMHETDKLLGMRRELSYVRDGILNKGAVDFRIPLSSGLESLHFLWWNAATNFKMKKAS